MSGIIGYYTTPILHIAVYSFIFATTTGFMISSPHASAHESATTIRYNGKPVKLQYKYRRAGGELLLFIHGLACSKESFYGAWEQKNLKKYSLLAVDLPGFGKSDRPENFSYSLPDHAGVLYELVRKLPHKKIHLVGHSMGGAIAVLLAQKNPVRFVSLMNVDGCLGGQNGSQQQQLSPPAPPTFEEFSEKLMLRIENSKGTPDENGYRLWYEWSRASDPLGFQKSDESLIQLTRSNIIIDAFFSLPIKKFYFYPERDGMPRVLKNAKKIKTIQITGSGHFIMNDNPDEFYGKLAKELSR